MRLTVLSAPLLLASMTFARSLHRRGKATDTCANINADLVFPDVVVDNKPYDAGHVDIGLCISQVDRIVDHYNVTEAAAKVVGMVKVKSAVVALIKKEGMQCSFPDHAQPIVTPNDECDFVCMNGFTALPTNKPTSCACLPPSQECNGKCGQPDLNCNTETSHSRRRSEPKCAELSSSPATCGGCVENPPGSLPANGINCNITPNVNEVLCQDSKCIVQSCKDGFTVSGSNNGCIADTVTRALSSGSASDVANAYPGEESLSTSSHSANQPPRQVPSSEGDRLPRGFAPWTSHSKNTRVEDGRRGGVAARR